MDKAGIIWYDKCLFKYSSKRFFGKIDIKNKFALCSSKNVSDSRSFNEKTKALLTKLTAIATRSSNEFVLYATGEMKLGKKKLYAMVQCTKDIWPSTVCKKCLDEIIEWLPDSCDGKDGVTVMSGSCYFRYETYPFLDTVQ